MSHTNEMDGEFSMAKVHRTILARNRDYLVRNLQLREVVDVLISAGLINQHMEELIFAPSVPSECTRVFLRNLPTFGPTAFEKFLDALRITHQSHIAEHITSRGDTLPSESGDIFNLISRHEVTLPAPREGNKGKPTKGATAMDYRSTVKYYDLHRSENVQVLIINNTDFGTVELDREGSITDLENLEHLFAKTLKFTVTTDPNLTADEMRSKIKSFSESDCLSDAEACIIVIMTHGLDGLVLGTDQAPVSIDEIVSYFLPDYCGKLVNKPKYFIFQSCRGDQKERGYDATDSGGEGGRGEIFHGIRHNSESEKSFNIPVLSDTLFSYPTIPGHVAWRNSKKGSWFIEALCKVFSEHANHIDVLTMLTMVTDEVIKNYGESYKQLCEFKSHLRGLFYLTPRQ